MKKSLLDVDSSGNRHICTLVGLSARGEWAAEMTVCVGCLPKKLLSGLLSFSLSFSSYRSVGSRWLEARSLAWHGLSSPVVSATRLWGFISAGRLGGCTFVLCSLGGDAGAAAIGVLVE